MLGRDVVAQALATLPPQVRAEYDGLGPLSWCSVHTTSAVLMAVAAHVRQEPKALQAAVVRAGVARTVRSIWRVLLSLTSDEQLIKRAPLVYSKSYQLGRVESSLTAPGQATFAVRGWPGIPELDMEGLCVGLAAVLAAAGRRDVATRWERTPDGANLVATWRK